VKGNVNHIAVFIIRGIHISESLNTIHGIDINVYTIDLAECLQVLRATPLAILPSGSHHFYEAVFFVLFGRDCTIHGTSSICGDSCPLGTTTLATMSHDKLHEIGLIFGHVVGENVANLVTMMEIAVQLVGQRIIKTIACEGDASEMA
jgi:hypothetical protein